MAPSFITCACGSSNRTDAKYCNKCGNLLLLKGRYNILSFVASGGFGSIYKGVDTLFSNRLVAVKEMTRNPHQSEKGIQDFKREALMLAGLEHRNLPRIYDHFVDGGRWYLVMDFIEGETLETYMSNTKEGKLPVDKALEISLKLAIVLDYLHSRQPPIIFRDLNPSNIMLTPNKEIYLIDFGISRHFQLGRLYTEKLGRVGFAAPEQYNKAIPVTLLSDIYSLGVTLHHMLTGIDPFNNRPQFFHFAPLKSFDPFISDELDTLVSQMFKPHIFF